MSPALRMANLYAVDWGKFGNRALYYCSVCLDSYRLMDWF
jgi:hypothetical protein